MQRFRARIADAMLADQLACEFDDLRVLGRDQSVVPAIIRYVEVRCLLAGTTTTNVGTRIISMSTGAVGELGGAARGRRRARAR